MERSPENKTALEVQKVFATSSGKTLYEALTRFVKPNVVQVPVDNTGRIDPLAVQYQEGKRAVMCQIDMWLKRNVNKVKQEKAEVK